MILFSATFWLSIAFIIFLLALSSFFSGAETALTAVSKARIQNLVKKGDPAAKRVQSLNTQKSRVIGALLLGNNLVNILASALTTSMLIAWTGESGVVYATVIMTLLILIFAEVLPKTYALNNADRMALRIAPILHAIVWILAPVVEAITAIVRFFLKLLRVNIGDLNMGSSVEELRGAIELHHTAEQHKQEKTRHERAMLHSVLDLADVEVGEIMIHRRQTVMLNIDEDSRKTIDMVLGEPYTRFPLWKNKPDNIIGILHTKDLLRELSTHHHEKEEAIDLKALSTEPWFVPETTPLLEQLQAFRQRREHFALVVDEYGSFMGIVTLEDILEEIVGDISDEHDTIVTGVRPQSNGSYLVDGKVTIRDLNRQFDWNLPDEDYATVGGLVLYETRSIPEVGQCFTFHNFRFDILRCRRHRLTLLRLTPSFKKL